jgi:hypothetical protein
VFQTNEQKPPSSILLLILSNSGRPGTLKASEGLQRFAKSSQRLLICLLFVKGFVGLICSFEFFAKYVILGLLNIFDGLQKQFIYGVFQLIGRLIQNGSKVTSGAIEHDRLGED